MIDDPLFCCGVLFANRKAREAHICPKGYETPLQHDVKLIAGMHSGLLETAIAIAVYVHDDTRDKREAPYILHPLRVMNRAFAMGLGRDAACAAVLHDVLEDTDVTMELLEECVVPPAALKILDALTRREGEKYRDFIDRIAGHSLAAVEVKLLDLEDNTDPARAIGTEAYREMVEKRYKPAIEHLKAARAIWAAKKVYE